MPRELITIQVGQCGNQVGCRFWDVALREHAAANRKGVYDEALSSFFRNVDSRSDDPADIPLGEGTGAIRTLKARAVLVDMEEGVINQLERGHLADIFDARQRITSVSGAGNNWAHGHAVYGPQYAEELLDKVRRAAEFCDSLQGFSLVHSLGGGTGSGLGTYLLPLLADEFPSVFRFVSCLFPGVDDDVITSPYNTVLALNQLIEHADCVLPADNGALAGIVERAQRRPPHGMGTRGGARGPVANVANAGDPGAKPRAFDEMNNIVASLLANLTAGMRFEGSLNVDLNEITTNLVPYPRMHFLLSSMAPLSSAPRGAPSSSSRVDQLFSDALARDHLLLDLRGAARAKHLAAALLVRGDVPISEVSRNVSRLGQQLDMIHWNEDGFKVGLCRVPPVGQDAAVLCLLNNCAVGSVLGEHRARFDRLYLRKAHLHHYTQYVEEATFDEARACVGELVDDYARLQASVPPAHVEHPLDDAIELR
mmetsp:Transcript_3203/g.9222  ORF Transcript_3203/g.9222 Transcript_3203/m.9222 type:complete len:482 (-) Transcript_3203:274-1719(-)